MSINSTLALIFVLSLIFFLLSLSLTLSLILFLSPTHKPFFFNVSLLYIHHDSVFFFGALEKWSQESKSTHPFFFNTSYIKPSIVNNSHFKNNNFFFHPCLYILCSLLYFSLPSSRPTYFHHSS